MLHFHCKGVKAAYHILKAYSNNVFDAAASDLEIAGQARNDSKGAASEAELEASFRRLRVKPAMTTRRQRTELKVAQQQAKRRQLKAAINDSALSFRAEEAAFGSFATVATPV